MRDLEDEYDFTGEWEGDVLHISRTGATGDVHILDDRVEVEVKLSLLLKPMRRVIEQHIEAELDELFPESTA
jgi:putative polyhydroxyalkanoate system protein